MCYWFERFGLILNSVYICLREKNTFKSFNKNIIPKFSFFIIKFIEYCTGKLVCCFFYYFLFNNLTFLDVLKYDLWTKKLNNFRKIIGYQLHIKESLHVCHLMFILKDPTIFTNWLIILLTKLNFWKYKLLIRYLWYIFFFCFQPHFVIFKIYGIKLKFKGKISVAGNARTRKIILKFGLTSPSTIKYKTVYDLNLIHTFTGVIGYQIWLFF